MAASTPPTPAGVDLPDRRTSERVGSGTAASVEGPSGKVDERERGFFCISLGQPNLKGRVEAASIDGRDVPFSQLGMEHVAIEDLTNSNAYHIPSGTLLICEAAAVPGGRPSISTCDIAPALLRNFGIEVPPYMNEARLVA